MQILIISYESWRETNNGGNVLSNIFSAFPEAKIAQIYCSGEMPQNGICEDYFQISDSMLLTKEKGRRLTAEDRDEPDSREPESIEQKINHSIPAPFKNASLLARELLWSVFDWKTEALERFVRDFRPDIIFAPCYYYYHVSMLALHVKRIAGCPMISYISDDNYSLKQLYFSPSFWINRLITRKWIRRLFSECSLIYTMTKLQKEEYEAIFHRPMKVLCKSAEFAAHEKQVGDPIRLIYAGNLLVRRWKTLVGLADALASVNASGVRAQLHIFSGTRLRARVMKKLNDGVNTVFHGLVPYQELARQYEDSDIAVFAESFDLKNRLLTRLSFSTKIIDCLNSGCAVLAIASAGQAGMAYLMENDAAICVNRIEDLTETVRELVERPEIIPAYSEKAKQLGRKNHRKSDIERMLRQDFYQISAQP